MHPATSIRRATCRLVPLAVALALTVGAARGEDAATAAVPGASGTSAAATAVAPAEAPAPGAAQGQPAAAPSAADVAEPATTGDDAAGRQDAAPTGAAAAPAVDAGGDAAVPPGDAAVAPADAAAGDAGLPWSDMLDGSASATLPHDLSPWGMFMAADLVVKAVMLGLAFASLITWTVAVAKGGELGIAGRRLRRARHVLARVASLDEAADGLARGRGPARALVEAAALERQMSAGLPAAGVKERVASRLDRVEAQATRSFRRGTGALATIGATAPFVGLLGTVWGIMNSFIGISEAQTTNLAVVAPGIAEALLATAIGLVAAIPAVVLYNHFARRIADHRLALADLSAEVMRLVSRDLDRRAGRHLAAAAE